MLLLKDLIESKIGCDKRMERRVLNRVGISKSLLVKCRAGYIPSIPVLKLFAQTFEVPERQLTVLRAKRSAAAKAIPQRHK
jgi:hypothetical protein